MKPIANFDKINEAGEYINIEPGIYPLVITDIIDVPSREYLEVYFDIAQGEFKDYYNTLEAITGRNHSKEIRSYKTNALPFFKAFITAIEKSNVGYAWNWDEKSLIGKYIIGVFGEEEYVKDGELRVSCCIQEFRSIPAYKEGKLRVPAIKKLPKPLTEEKPAANIPLPDVEFPF